MAKVQKLIGQIGWNSSRVRFNEVVPCLKSSSALLDYSTKEALDYRTYFHVLHPLRPFPVDPRCCRARHGKGAAICAAKMLSLSSVVDGHEEVATLPSLAWFVATVAWKSISLSFYLREESQLDLVSSVHMHRWMEVNLL